jgi:hypothetical protein
VQAVIGIESIERAGVRFLRLIHRPEDEAPLPIDLSVVEAVTR